MQQSLPDITLCNKCKPLGFCLAAKDENNSVLQSKLLNYNLADVKNLIPIRAINSQDFHYNDYAKDNLQKAFDAFHQDDYETAILLFRMIVDDNAQMKDVHLYLGISYFFNKDYENALSFISYYLDREYTSKTELLSWLLDLCSNVKNESTVPIPPQKSLLNCTVDCKITAQ